MDLHWNNLRSAQGVGIRIGYEVFSINNETEMTATVVINPRIYAEAPGASRVEAVLINAGHIDGMPTRQDVQPVTLEPENDYGLFAGLLGTDLTVKVTTDKEEIYTPQIAVRVDGVWQDDPWQAEGMHNFNFAWLGVGS